MTATRTGAWPLLWPPLLLLLPGLPGQPWGAEAQAQVCSINKTLFEVKENSNVSEPLVDIYVPDGLQVALGPSTTPSAFRMQGTQLFLSSSPDYEATTFLEADLECRRGTTVVTRLRVFVTVLDVNDNPPRFPFDTLQKGVEEDTKVNSTVIPETELEAKDLDESDTLFYTLQEVTPGAGVFFSLAGANHPALRLDRTLDFDKWSEMTFRLLVRDTQQEDKQPSHTATATLILKVLPADLRPPWFLPCSYSDGHVCIQAQYQGAVPTGHTLPGPLILRPGPIYAEDGDSGIGQPIIYSLLGGNQGGVFIIDANSGNLTMASGIPSPTTFVLLVKGEQADLARYSVTQVTVEARAATGSPPRFPQSLYQGTVVPGSGAGTVVRDATSPAQPLRIQAQDPDFPDFNSAITYRITNCSEFRMEGETVLTTTQLPHAVVFYAEVEATNTVTTAMATTVAEIRVSEQEAPSTGTSRPTSPDTGSPSSTPTTTRSSTQTLTPGTSRPTSPDTGSPSSTPTTTRSSTQTLTPGTSRPTSPDTGSPSSTPTTTRSSTQTLTPGTSRPTSPDTGSPSSTPTTTRSSTQTLTPGTSRPTSPDTGSPSSTPTTTRSSTQTLTPGTSRPTSPDTGSPSSTPTTTRSSTQTLTPGTSRPPTPGTSQPASSGAPVGDGQLFSVVDMAVLGGVLGALLLLALLGVAFLAHKLYGPWFKCCSDKVLEPAPSDFDNQAFLPGPDDANRAPTPSAGPEPPPAAPPSPAPSEHAPGSPATTHAQGSPEAVRSILTKERRPEGGYKAVWFGEDIGAEADVVVINTPGADGAGDEDVGPDPSPHDAPGTEYTYI
ncbi:cadherin-related family member 5 isoform X3 [Lepus europaeus]|uniref:cadherin-related family member 5 isoform X3 n=1 Tax=Lepus europaeus TaxID=9983 RepID=UPI002B4A834F|nr:cadherin-related family member 5 isoform X3 [Lepus europaeus]